MINTGLMKNIYFWMAGLFLFCLFHEVSAYSFNRNQSHLNWKVAETEHFRFYFDKKMEPVAEYVAGIAENLYKSKIDRYNIVLPGKVEFVVREDVVSNGFANPYQNTLNIWVSDWG
ncbi:MAG: hypothetical protein HQK83_08535, partial [Fibrobacteria bacterium]|nr:hypothetical protein [Fibrobacteria bacterium]